MLKRNQSAAVPRAVGRYRRRRCPSVFIILDRSTIFTTTATLFTSGFFMSDLRQLSKTAIYVLLLADAIRPRM
jgi:hypothetical protein